MATNPDAAASIRGLQCAADRLVQACAGAAVVLFEHPDTDPLAAGVAAISRVYDCAAPKPRRRARRTN